MFTSTGPAAVAFFLGVVLSLGGSAVLVTRIERLAGRFDISEAILGLTVALAADSPEIASAITAAARDQKGIGVGIVLGSNAFNLAALLGLGSIVAGRIVLHRKVVLLEGTVAVWVALVSIVTISVGLDARVGLALVLVAVVPYVILSGASADSLLRLGLPTRAVKWLHSAVEEAETEISAAIHPMTSGRGDVVVTLVSLAVVVGASAAMEQAAVVLGKHFNVSSIVTGAIVLAVATSLPNAVGAIFLARKGRGAAVLSETMNSNTLNVLVGLFIPACFVGLARPSGQVMITAAWYGGLTLVGLSLAYLGRGLDRRAGSLIMALYLAFVVIAITL